MCARQHGDVAEQIRHHPYGAVRARCDGAGALIGEPPADDVRYEFTGYSYVGWDPVNRTDPTGRDAGLTILIAFVIGFAAFATNAAVNGASFGESLRGFAVGVIGLWIMRRRSRSGRVCEIGLGC